MENLTAVPLTVSSSGGQIIPEDVQALAASTAPGTVGATAALVSKPGLTGSRDAGLSHTSRLNWRATLGGWLPQQLLITWKYRGVNVPCGEIWLIEKKGGASQQLRYFFHLSMHGCPDIPSGGICVHKQEQYCLGGCSNLAMYCLVLVFPIFLFPSFFFFWIMPRTCVKH